MSYLLTFDMDFDSNEEAESASSKVSVYKGTNDDKITVGFNLWLDNKGSSSKVVIFSVSVKEHTYELDQ